MSDAQIKRLKSLGNTKFYNDYPSPNKWLERCNEGNIICSGKFGLTKKLYKVHDKFFSLPFVNIGWINKTKLKQNNLTISYTPGSNKSAVTEWIISMMILLSRNFFYKIKIPALDKENAMKVTTSITKKNITILGNGNIGKNVEKICKAFNMKVTFFKRGDDLKESTKNADFVLNCLSTNKNSIGLLDKEFFNSLKKGTFFLTITGPEIYDVNAMLDALDKGILAGVADELGGSPNGDTNNLLYKKLTKHPKILTTPHISYQSDLASKITNDMMIDNVEAFLKNSPINLIN